MSVWGGLIARDVTEMATDGDAEDVGDTMAAGDESAVAARLRDLGVDADWTGHCTYSDPERFFSYRRATHEGAADYGRLISAIRL